jgi:hypothetical protein
MSPHVYHGETYGFTPFYLSVRLSGCHTFVNATPTFLDGFGNLLAQSKMMMPRCAWSKDFPVCLLLQELWPLTLKTFHNFFLLMQLLLHFSTDLDETWHIARWCLDVYEVRIFRLLDFCKSYGPLHLDIFGYKKQIPSSRLNLPTEILKIRIHRLSKFRKLFMFVYSMILFQIWVSKAGTFSDWWQPTARTPPRAHSVPWSRKRRKRGTCVGRGEDEGACMWLCVCVCYIYKPVFVC